jgi:hypothetical protein
MATKFYKGHPPPSDVHAYLTGGGPFDGDVTTVKTLFQRPPTSIWLRTSRGKVHYCYSLVPGALASDTRINALVYRFSPEETAAGPGDKAPNG